MVKFIKNLKKHRNASCGKIPDTTELIHAEVYFSNNTVGSICMIECVDGVYNISVSTLSEFQSKGIATELVKSCIRWWNSHDRHDTLHYWANETNIPSNKICKKCDFIFVESSKGFNHYIYERGRYQN